MLTRAVVIGVMRALVLTVSELALLLEGSELVGRAPLSPEPYKLVPL